MRLRALVSVPQTSPTTHATADPEKGAELRYPGVGKVFLIWMAIGLLTSFRYQFQRPPNSNVSNVAFITAFTASYCPWVALTPLVFRLEKRFALGDGKWVRNLGVLAMISVPLCLLAGASISGVSAGVLFLFQSAVTKSAPRFWWGHFPMAEVLFWCSVAMGYFVRTQYQLRHQEQRAARLALEKSQLEAGLKQAQLDVIRARLNPHFLFNSLQNISAMTKQDPQTASRMLARLGDLLRAVLRQDSEPESTLYEEIELTQAYVALEQMRFGERLIATFDIAQDVQSAMVPSFLLQPLIENAVIHGLRGVGRTGLITVSGAKESSNLVLTVTDNGIGPPEGALSGRKMGVGLGSTRERLATMYPERHTFSMKRLEEGGAEVRIAIPIRFEDEERPFHNEHSAAADR